MAKCLEDVGASQDSYHCSHGGYNGLHGCAGEAYTVFMIIVFRLAAFRKVGIYSKSLQ